MGYVNNQYTLVHLKVAINFRSRVGWQAISQDCCISPLQQDTKSPPEVTEHLSLILPILQGKCSPQFLHLSLCQNMPPPQETQLR